MTATASVDAAPRPGRLSAVHPLLFAAYPVLFLWSQNLGETNAGEVLVPLVVVVGGAALATVLLGLVLGDRRRAALIVSPIVIASLMYGHVATYAADVRLPGLAQQLGWVLLVVIGVVAAFRLSDRRLATVDTALDRIAAILVIVALVLIAPFQASSVGSSAPVVIGSPQAVTTTAPKRDVYWLIFDRYGSDRSYELLHGIHNDLTTWLREQGFTVLDKSHANYVRTVTSMATTLNMTHLADVPGIPDPSATTLGPIHAMIQSSLVARQFKALGYRYYHIGSWSGPTSTDNAADVNLNLPSSSDFTTALLDESVLPPVMKRLRMDNAPGDERARHYRYGRYGLDALAGLRDEPGPKFVYSHILLPHPPPVFDRDGSFMSASEVAGLSDKEALERQLAYTNTRIHEIIGGLLALPEERRPIIILQADEGPETETYHATRTSFDWTAASDEEVETKFGILNAWYLPGGEDLGLDPKQTSINTFPILFDRYFGLDYALLPDRVYASRRYQFQYDLLDVTDRLPSLR